MATLAARPTVRPTRLSGRVGGEECLIAVEAFESEGATCLRRYSLSVVH